MKLFASSIMIFTFCGISLYGQEPTDAKDTEDWSRKPVVVTPVDTKWPRPADAIILLDENNCSWTKQDGSPIEWTINNGIMTVKPGSGGIYSGQKFEDCHLHIEWRSPIIIKGEGQGRGNSGIFLQSLYEVQVLDSYNNETYFNGQAGSIYKQHPPLANACTKSGEWNVFDIIYRAPKFDYTGEKIESGRITVIHNGIVIQNNVQIFGTTPNSGFPKNPVHHGAPLMLQDHSDLVSYRNIWVRRL
ncbi:MAG: DUF1080 domain-containing protein [Saprospiraceae bacterium]|jgi:hypothetical protein|nr:DUF1080 domain-containing protein [Saprospiraceae bacterium]